MIYVSTPEEAHQACQELRRHETLALDIEGQNLSRNGIISLVQIATRETCYLFDILHERELFSHGLKDLLEDSNRKKIVFDCRKDSDALHQLHDVILKGVLDLQLLEMVSRDDTQEQARERLIGKFCLHRGNVNSAPELYFRVRRLLGLSRCLSSHGLGDKKLKDSVAAAFKADQNYWLTRPLPEDALLYATQDVKFLFSLKDLYYEKLDSSITNEYLLECSERYARFYSEMNNPFPASLYFEHSLMPLGILDNFCGSGTGFICICCRRRLDENLLSKNAKKIAKKRKCDVCRAIDIREEMKKGWGKNSKKLNTVTVKFFI